MIRISQPALYLTLFLSTITATVNAQGVNMGEVLIVSSANLKKEVKPEDFRDYVMKEVSPVYNKQNQGISLNLFQADRGEHKGDFLLVCSATNLADRKTIPPGSPFIDLSLARNGVKPISGFLNDPYAYTEYRLLGAGKLKNLSRAGILGIHYIQVKPDRSTEFEKFVVDKLNPTVGQLFPDMQLLYYKAVAGEAAGSYITIFSIASPAARDKYWPAGAPETELLKQAFHPLKDLAIELGTYLVEGSYLLPESGGAAAYYESRKWTDFVQLGYLK